jgi:hypothetical protein
MKKYIFVTPEGFSYKPSYDSPDPDPMDMQIFNFSKEPAVKDALSDLIELNNYTGEDGYRGNFSIRIENDNKRNIWLRNKQERLFTAS